MKFEGHIWKFGDDINTDLMTPSKWLVYDLPTIAAHAMEIIDPRFAKEVKPGDLVLGGRNFGGGSSRESAVRAFKELKVACVLAESFARIFYRNAIAIGLPVVTVPKEFYAEAQPSDTASIDLVSGELINKRTHSTYRVQALPERVRSVLAEGGIVPMLKKQSQLPS